MLTQYSRTLREMEATTRAVFSSFRRKRIPRPQRARPPKASRLALPLPNLDMRFPSGNEMGCPSLAKLMAEAGRRLGGSGLRQGNVFSSFG